MAFPTFFDHFRAVRGWAAQHDAKVEIDIQTVQLEIRCANVYFRFYPIFAASVRNKLVHIEDLMESVIAFGGWRPYRPYSTPLSTEKRLFKQHLDQAGVRTPQMWPPGQQPAQSYIRKKSRGSFGYDIQGPFLATVPVPPLEPNSSDAGTFHEQFVAGKIVKIWYWGHTPFFADMQDYATVTGDGVSTAGALAEAKLKQDVGANILADKAILVACMAYQSFSPTDVLSAGQEMWIDFRYGRSFAPRQGAAKAGSALTELKTVCGEQIAQMGALMRTALQEVAPAPLAYSVDAVLDDEGQLWWLELNSHPMFPHSGYDVMLSDIFNRTAGGESP